MPALELRDVTFQYATATEPAVRHLSLAVEAGTLAAIVGPNGSGKTTVCNLIRGFAPTYHQGEMSGAVIVQERDIEQADLGLLGQEIGFVFQNPFVQISGAADTVFEEVAFGLENLGVPVDEMRRRAAETLALLGIEELATFNPMELSGGQKQRVAFASTIAMDPPIYVVDEPTSQLDPKGTEEVFTIIRQLQARGKTVVLVEHKLELVAEYADTVFVLDGGELMLTGTPREVFTAPALADPAFGRPAYADLGLALTEAGLWTGSLPVTRAEAGRTLTCAAQLAGAPQ
jgi:energy-coupling factor transport system ATP-binding protein